MTYYLTRASNIYSLKLQFVTHQSGQSFNQVNPGSDNFSAILGGYNNISTGAYSAILGGKGNSDGGFSYAGVFGNGVIAVAATAQGRYVVKLVVTK